MKRTLMLLSLIAFATAALARDRKPELPLLDAAKLTAVKRVAVFSVYGPEAIHSGFSTSASGQQLYDAAEQSLVATLKSRGMEVVPLATTRALVDAEYAAAYTRNLPPRKQKEVASPAAQEMFRRGYGLTFGKVLASANTHLFFGADYNWKTSEAHQTGKGGGDNDSFEQPPANPDEASRKALAELAAKAGADAYVVMRVVPSIATTVAREQSKWNPLGTITKGMSAVRAIKEGDHGFATLDVLMGDTSGNVIYQDQIVGMSKETAGAGGGFNMRMAPEEMETLTKSALGEAVPQLSARLDGRKAS